MKAQIAQCADQTDLQGVQHSAGLRCGKPRKAAMIAALTKEAAASVFADHHAVPVDGARGRCEEAAGGVASADSAIRRRRRVAQNNAEEESRQEANTLDRLMTVVKKGPDVTAASKVGEPTLVDPTPVSANGVWRDTHAAGDGSSCRRTWSEQRNREGWTSGGERAGSAFRCAPRWRMPILLPVPIPPAAADPNELKPAAAPDANELKPDPNELKPIGKSKRRSERSAGAGANADERDPAGSRRPAAGPLPTPVRAPAGQRQGYFKQQEEEERRD